MRILLVAPDHPSLPLPAIAAEIAAIARLHQVERVIGDVRPSDIEHAIEKGVARDGPFDCVWWATHGNDQGLELSDGALSANGIGQYVASSGARLCVLNTCDSEEVAYLIIAGGKADMIYTISPDIKDPDALRFGIQLAQELAKTEDFEVAFDAAKGPGSTKYRFLNATAALRGFTATVTERLQEKVDELNEGQYKINAKLEVFGARVERVEQVATQNQALIASNQTQAMQNQRQAMQSATSAGQIADLDRNAAQAPRPSQTASQITPMLTALVILIVLVALLIGKLYL